MQRLTPSLWGTLAAALAAGCSTPPTLPGNRLVASLVGAWRVEGPRRSDCPAQLDRPLPTGRTRWTDQAGLLHIASLTGETPPVAFAPVDATSLSHTTEVSLPGCTGLETLTLVITHLGEAWSSGEYTATFSHDGGAACAQLLDEAALPERCETTVSWQARRL